LGGYDELKRDIRDHHTYRAENRILYIPFTDVGEYLAILQASSMALAPLGSRAMIYLAAAVSDFYIPPEQMSVHKIQSDDKLDLQLSQVPKLLGHIKHEWAPDAFLVSFKLETDHDLMVPKSRRAISKYGVDLVVANELHVSISVTPPLPNFAHVFE
jgi:phosphopantothenate-cysteine ligase